jgi:hypothetical protein
MSKDKTVYGKFTKPKSTGSRISFDNIERIKTEEENLRQKLFRSFHSAGFILLDGEIDDFRNALKEEGLIIQSLKK